MIYLGFQQKCITPVLPAYLRGYAIERLAKEAHDDVYARCLLIDDGNTRYVIAQCDLLAVDGLLVEEVYQRVAGLDISKENILIFATHTHSGPGGVINTATGLFSQMQNLFGKTDPEYIRSIADRISSAVHHAAEDLQPARLTIGRGRIENVGKERHDPALPGDDSLLVFQFTRADGTQVLLYNYACHPTVTGSGNTKMTADFPYAVEQVLDYDMVVYINGACGDISTRFTRKESSFLQAEVFGKEIAQSIEAALSQPIYEGAWDAIAMHQYPVTLPTKKVLPIAQAQAELAKYEAELEAAKQKDLDAGTLRTMESYVEGARSAIQLATALQDIRQEVLTFALLDIQDIRIAVIPGELFSTLGHRLKRQGIEVFGYGNGYCLYIADEKAYDQGFYEAMSSPFEKGVGERLVQEIVARAKEL